jgi:hypothetical protein
MREKSSRELTSLYRRSALRCTNVSCSRSICSSAWLSRSLMTQDRLVAASVT